MALSLTQDSHELNLAFHARCNDIFSFDVFLSHFGDSRQVNTGHNYCPHVNYHISSRRTRELRMCGILAIIGETTVPDDISLSSSQPQWHTTSPENFIRRHLARFPLTSRDQAKLTHQTEIRNIHDQQTKLRANLKLSQSEKLDKLEQLEQQLDDILGPNDDHPTYPDVNMPLNSHHISQLVDAVATRGPDYLGYHIVAPHIHMCSSVLLLRLPFTPQPGYSSGIVLQYNGELYSQMSTNDTAYILKQLHHELAVGTDRRSSILRVLAELDGEFAVVIYDTVDHKVYFGRDRVGRRSLVFRHTPHQLVISLVGLGPGLGFEEVDNRIWIYDINSQHLEKVAYPEKSLANGDFTTLLSQAVKQRWATICPIHPHLVPAGVLFSGGLDCTIIAHMLADIAPGQALDLITVGFDHPRSKQLAASSPDRVLAKRLWFHLCQLHGTNLRLVEINVTYQQWLQGRHRVQSLMAPTVTEMDLSIAIAFYFASAPSEGEASINVRELVDIPSTYEEYCENEDKFTKVSPYSSRAPVLFLGLGADELFAGYLRHEALFANMEPDDPKLDNAYHQLHKMLDYDIDVIHTRNLGRDDRVMASWGKELRYPYLDEAVIASAESIPPQQKLMLSWEWKESKKQGRRQVMVPKRKHYLRRVARSLGLAFVADEPKRAIQFGAKLAKLEINQAKAKGTDILV